MNKETLKRLLTIVFESGRWLGQVDLEEHMDNEQYSQCVAEVIEVKKTTMPSFPASELPLVQYRLRSEKWREGVGKTTKAQFNICLDTLLDVFLENNKKQRRNKR